MAKMTYDEGLWQLLNGNRGNLSTDLEFLFLYVLYHFGYLDNKGIFFTDEEVEQFIEKKLKHGGPYSAFLNIIWGEAHFFNFGMCDFVNRLTSITPEWYSEYFVRAFDDMCSYVSESRRTDICVPGELSSFIYSLAQLKEKSLVYNPFSEGADLCRNMPKDCFFFGQEANESLYHIGLLRLIAHGIYPRGFRHQDSFKEWMGQSDEEDIDDRYYFDFIVSCPPLGLRVLAEDGDCTLDIHWPYFSEPAAKRISMDDYVVALGKEGLKPGGKSIFVLPQGFFFRGGQTARLRRRLVEDGRVEMVVQLPSSLLINSLGVHLSLIVLNDGRNPNNRTIRFVDGQSFAKKSGRKNILLSDDLISAIRESKKEFVKDISIEEIGRDDYKLVAAKYFQDNKINVPEGFSLVKLGDIASLYKSRLKCEDNVRIVRGRDLKSKDVYEYTDFKDLREDSGRKLPRIDRDSILVLKVGNLKPTLFKFRPDLKVVSGENVVMLLPKEGIDSHYLVSEMRKPYVKEQVKSLSRGVVIPHLSEKDILRLQILFPTERKLQHSIFLNERRQDEELVLKSAEVKDYVERERDRIHQMISIKRHRIAPYLSGLKSNVSVLLDELKSGTLNKDKEIVSGYTVLDALENMRDNLTDVSNLFKSLKLDDNIGEAESLDIYEFVKRYSYLWKIPGKSSRLAKDFSEKKAHFPHVSFNGDNLKEIIDEIIFNAEKHFVSKSGNLVELKLDLLDDRVCLKVLNNGAPVPEDFDESRSFVAGYHKDAEGTGQGLFRVRQVSDEFGADIHWENDSLSPMPVCLCITFKSSED